MKKQTLIIGLTVLFAGILLGNMVIGQFIFTILIPTIGRTKSVEITVTWQENGTKVTQIDWGLIENGTETLLLNLINITNTGDKDVTLLLNAANEVNITDLTLSWNYTGSTLQPDDSVVVQLNQTVTTSEQTFGYDTRIDATG